ncbi:MAG: hypothetical protein HS126_39310 [Anaerolineales bacterium]|nr:hypothetical protein [Anaerolineales bacterium]
MTGTSHSEHDPSRHEQLRQILQMHPDNESCQNCLDQLDDYVASQLAGEDYLDSFPEIAIHLDACPDCAGAYARLYELVLADTAEQLPQPKAIPQPDLTFLQANSLVARLKTASQLNWEMLIDLGLKDSLVARLKTALQRTGNTLRLQFSAELLTLLQPPELLATTRTAADEERYSEVLARLDPALFLADMDDEGLEHYKKVLARLDSALVPDLELPLKLTIYRDRQQPTRCLIEVVVEPAGKSWPNLAESIVTLHLGEAKRYAATDAWGVASFEDIPVDALEQMSLEVTLAE